MEYVKLKKIDSVDTNIANAFLSVLKKQLPKNCDVELRSGKKGDYHFYLSYKNICFKEATALNIKELGTCKQSIIEAAATVEYKYEALLQDFHRNKSSLSFVDLALPSGTLWGDCNVGADKPSDTGGFFAWGSDKRTVYYGKETYKWFKNNEITKYRIKTKSKITCDDQLYQLQPEDDTATLLRGNGWRMPYSSDFTELKNNCTMSFVRNFLFIYTNGLLFISNNNGRSLYLPACGMVKGYKILNQGECINYWTGDLARNNCAYTMTSYLEIGLLTRSMTDLYWGLTIRPVRNKV
ncbi:MAG: hypothetical protein MJZ02_05210 [Paludibacteraceae bacterium]|nr:hypothetical protein [Paludibacteraceae bacterium]